MKIQYPESMKYHVDKVLAGEYDLPWTYISKIRAETVVLDVGANVGAFAIWANARWPGATIHCYEPLQANFDLLKLNLDPLKNVLLHRTAVGNPENQKLFLGKNNCGENSFFDLGEQRPEFEVVATIDPNAMPPANVLKIDAEGSEWDILSRLHRIDYDLILMEYHGEILRRKIDALLADYSLVGGAVRSLDRGTLKYLNNRLVQ